MTLAEIFATEKFRRYARLSATLAVGFLLLAAISATSPSRAQEQNQEPEQNQESEQNQEEEPPAEEPEAPSDSGKKSIFLTMEPLVAPVLDERNIKGNITLVMKLHLKNPENEEKIRLRMPKITDAYLNYLYRYGSSAASSGVMQLDAIVRSLQRLTDKILGKDEVQVLLHEVSRTRTK